MKNKCSWNSKTQKYLENVWRSSFLVNLQASRLIASNVTNRWTPSQAFFNSVLSPPPCFPHALTQAPLPPPHQILKSPPCSQTFRKPCYLGTYHFPCFLGTCVNLFRLNRPDKALFDPLKVLEHLQYFKHLLFRSWSFVCVF